MLVTEFGMEMFAKPVHCANAYFPIAVTEVGITVFLQPSTKEFVFVWMIALLLSRLS